MKEYTITFTDEEIRDCFNGDYEFSEEEIDEMANDLITVFNETFYEVLHA